MLAIFSFEKPEELRPLGRSRRRWKYIVNMDRKLCIGFISLGIGIIFRLL
jgi:hypothetical protein